MAQRQTLADFGLQRRTRQNFTAHWYTFLEGKADPVKMARDGQNFFTEAAETGDRPEKAGLDDVSFTHVQNVAEKTFVVIAAFLRPEWSQEQRYTDMRAWQMIVDAWLTGGGTQPAGTPEGLQYLAFHDVTEPEAQLSMQRELDRGQWRAGTAATEAASSSSSSSSYARSVEMTPSTANWATNPWIRCSQRVAVALSTSARQIEAARAWAICMDHGSYHLIVELTSTSAPDALADQAVPAAPAAPAA